MTTTQEILDRLISLPTVSADSNLAVIGFIEDFLSSRGFETHRILDVTGTKAGLFARLGPADRPGVMLSAADRATQMSLAQPLKLAFTWDEEVGCIGIPQMLPKLEPSIGKPSLCIVGEPTCMQIALGHKGKVVLRATCHGTNGHSAMAPDYLNAIHLAADFIGKLRVIQSDLVVAGGRDADYGIPYATVHVGKIAGGTALNIVPERAVAATWRGAFPSARIEVETQNAYPGLNALPDGPEVSLMKRFVPEAGLTKVSFGTEAGYFAGAGVPTLVSGPGSMDQGHKPDEFIETSQLAACDAMCDRILQHLTQ